MCSVTEVFQKVSMKWMRLQFEERFVDMKEKALSAFLNKPY